MNVVALLPYLVEHYDEPSTVCIDAAISIANVSLSQPWLLQLSAVDAHVAVDCGDNVFSSSSSVLSCHAPLD